MIIEFKNTVGADVIIPLDQIDHILLTKEKLLFVKTSGGHTIQFSQSLDAQRLYDTVRDLLKARSQR